MFCMSCGKAVPEGAGFCAYCGRKLEIPSQPRRPSSGPSFLAILFFFVLLGGIAVVGLLVFVTVYNTYQNAGGAAPSVFTTEHPIVNQTFEVPARSYKYFSFGMPGGGNVRGNFQAFGGKNDIEVAVFDENGFINFQNGNRASRVYYYSGGYVTVADMNQYLPPGRYYLVFNNRDALLTDKVVTAKIDAVY